MLGIVAGIDYEVARTIGYIRSEHNAFEAQQMADVGVQAALILLRYDYEEDKRNRSPVDFYFKVDESNALEALAEIQNARELWSMFSEHGTNPMRLMGLGSSVIPIGETGGVELSIEDESALWNVHRLFRNRGIKMNDPEVRAALNGMTALLEDRDVAHGIIASLIDWMDLDSDPVDPEGAEKFYYQSLEPPYENRNGPIQHNEELRAIKGVDEDIYSALISAVTTWPNDLVLYSQYKININTAPAATLMFLDERMDEAMVDNIVAARDDAAFEKVSDVQRFFQKELEAPKIWGSILQRGSCCPVPHV